MRFAGVVASRGVMMSFSRRIGTCPSIKRRVRWSSLVTTQSPMMIRSRGLSSTLSAIRWVLVMTHRARCLVNEALSGGNPRFPPLSPPPTPRPCYKTALQDRFTRPFYKTVLFAKLVLETAVMERELRRRGTTELAEQPQHRLIGLRGERQCRG